jgi:phosphohistidine swiveling domain-containing protein
VCPTSSATVIARELDIQIISAADISGQITDGDLVAFNAGRGVIYTAGRKQ